MTKGGEGKIIHNLIDHSQVLNVVHDKKSDFISRRPCFNGLLWLITLRTIKRGNKDWLEHIFDNPENRRYQLVQV